VRLFRVVGIKHEEMKKKRGKGRKGGYPHCYKYLSRYTLSIQCACPSAQKNLINQAIKNGLKQRYERRRKAAKEMGKS